MATLQQTAEFCLSLIDVFCGKVSINNNCRPYSTHVSHLVYSWSNVFKVREVLTSQSPVLTKRRFLICCPMA